MELVSIIMPTYNTPYEFLREAVDSIKKQSYLDFELLIINDGSTKYNDHNVWESIVDNDPRIFIINNTHKKGVAGALNTGLDNARGKYIFRMDADDVSTPDRLECQVSYLENNPEVDLLAGYIKCFGASNNIEKSEISNAAIRAVFCFQSGIAHPSVCFRKASVDKYSLRYCEDVQSEDYELWTRCAELSTFVFATLPRIILYYRVHERQVSKTRNAIMVEQGKKIRFDYLSKQCENIDETRLMSFIEYSMYINSNITIHELLLLEKSICNDISKSLSGIELRQCRKAFWKTCLKKSVSHFFRGDIKQLLAILANALRYITDTSI